MWHRLKAVGVLTVLGLATGPVLAGPTQVLVSEDFSTDPIAAGRAVAAGANPDAGRFTYSSGTLTAGYDTSLGTTKLLWSLGRTLTQNDVFGFNIDFRIPSLTTSGLGQVAFGFVNSVTTGNDRPGGEGASAIPYPHDGSDANDAHDTVSVDYFPFDNSHDPIFAYQTRSLTPTVIASDDGNPTTSFFNQFSFTSFNETLIDDAGEPNNLSLGVNYRIDFTYDPLASRATLRLMDLDTQQWVNINATGGSLVPGGPDGDPTTIQVAVNPGAEFSVDSFGLLLWQDTYAPMDEFDQYVSTLTSDVVVDQFQVLVPEPATVGSLLAAAGLLALRRRRTH